MTIQEMEQKSGLERASIRYYEQEGLLTPQRKSNGYRDYSEEDATTLARVKFLRSLGFSVQEIRNMQSGVSPLCDLLPGRIQALEKEQHRLNDAEQTCRAMQQDCADYATLDAKKYQQARPALRPPESDRIRQAPIPWRRYFARTFDYELYTAAFTILLTLCFRFNLGEQNNVLWNIMEWGVVVLTFILIEPLLLHWFGTTPGKWIWGLRVEDCDGKKPALDIARSRTLDMLWSGEGFYLPFYALYRNWKSYKAHDEGEFLPWEGSTHVILKDRKWWRPCAHVAGMAALVLCLFLATGAARTAPNAGKLTVQDYAENYNTLAWAYNLQEAVGELDENGQPADDQIGYGHVVIDLFDDTREEVFYETDDEGYIQRITWRFFSENGMVFHIPMTTMEIAATAALPREGNLLTRGLGMDPLNKLFSGDVSGQEHVLKGGKLTWSIEQENYVDIGGRTYFAPEDKENAWIQVEMVIEAVGTADHR